MAASYIDHAWVARMAASYMGDREQGSLLQRRRNL
jgi:hypothetical protein